jgi:hypothetical protein
MTLALMMSVPPAHGQDGVQLPDQVFGSDVISLIVIDTQQLTPDRLQQGHTALLDSLSGGDAQTRGMLQQRMSDAEQAGQRFANAHSQFSQAGGRALVVGMLPPADGGNEPQAFGLVHAEPGSDPGQLSQALAQMDENGEASELQPYVDGWWYTSDDEMVQPPQSGDMETANQLREALSLANGSSVAIGMRMNDQMREGLAQAMNNPQAAMFAPAITALQQMEIGGAGVAVGDQPGVDITLQFANEQAAQQFNQAWTTLTMLGHGMLSAQMSQMPAAQRPDPQVIQQAFTHLQMGHDANQCTLSLGEEFLGSLSPLVQQYAQMQAGQMQQQPALEDSGEMPEYEAEMEGSGSDVEEAGMELEAVAD